MFRYPAVLVTFLLVVPTMASAQEFAIDRGAVGFGGTVSFFNRSGDLYADSNTLQVNPMALYFVGTGLAIGAEAELVHRSWSDDSDTDYSVGPVAAYFFGDAESTSYPFVGASVQYVDVSGRSGFGYGVAAGIVYMLSSHVGLVTQASFNILSLEDEFFDETETGNTLGLEVGLNAFLF